MTAYPSSQTSQLLSLLHSRRAMLKAAGGLSMGLAAAGPSRVKTALATLTDQQQRQVFIETIYNQTYVAPHIDADFSRAFYRGGWQRNGNASIYFNFQELVDSGDLPPADAEVFGQPLTLYVSSTVLPKEGGGFETGRYLKIATYASETEAAAALARAVGAGPPSGATLSPIADDEDVGSHISYVTTTDLQGTPANQVFCKLGTDRFFFEYQSLTPSTASALVAPETVHAEAADLRRTAQLWASGETIASRDFVQQWSVPQLESVNRYWAPLQFVGASGVVAQWDKWRQLDYLTFGSEPAVQQFQTELNAKNPCKYSQQGRVPGTNVYAYCDARFFPDEDAAADYFDSIPTPTQQAADEFNQTQIQPDSDVTNSAAKGFFQMVTPGEDGGIFPGYTLHVVDGPVVVTYSFFDTVNQAGLTGIDPDSDVFKALRLGAGLFALFGGDLEGDGLGTGDAVNGTGQQVNGDGREVPEPFKDF